MRRIAQFFRSLWRDWRHERELEKWWRDNQWHD